MPHQRLIQNTIVIIVVIVLIFCVRWGFSAGRDIARTKITAANVASIQRGLDFFYSDQSRYPSISEFENLDYMKVYFDNFPPQNFKYELCSPHYAYTTFRQLSYQLDFCLPRSKGNLVKGKNTITEKSPFLEAQ